MIKFKTRLYKKIIKNMLICTILSISISYGQNDKINPIISNNKNDSRSFTLIRHPIYSFETWRHNPTASNPSFVVPPKVSAYQRDFKISPTWSFFLVDFLPQDQNNPSSNILHQILPSDQDLSTPLSQELKDNIVKKEFLISYKLYVENGVAQGEKYNISEPIKKRTQNNNYEFDYTCKIDTHTTNHTDEITDYELKAILNYQKEAVLECLYKSGVKVIDDSLTHNAQSHTKTLLTLQAKTVEVYLDNNFLVLEVWKGKK